jgi:hypothetical protein
LATYTFNGERSFTGESFGSLAAFYCERWLPTIVALFVGFHPRSADHS